MKTYIFHYNNWQRLPDGRQAPKMLEYKTKALTRAEAETHFWDSQIKRKTFGKYIKVEIIENRKRVLI
jgi:hypothetical protein